MWPRERERAAGRREVVLALSGEADHYHGWGQALHERAGVPNDFVRVVEGQTTTVELMLTVGPPTLVTRRR